MDELFVYCKEVIFKVFVLRLYKMKFIGQVKMYTHSLRIIVDTRMIFHSN